MKIILALLVILIIILIIDHMKKIETFEYQSKTINVAILFTGYNIDEWDYKFVEKWHNDIKFYFIWNKDKKTTDESNKYGDKISKLSNVTTFERENYGWDATAWKEGINKYYNELKTYDEIFLLNNSMNYEKLNMKQISELAVNYDIYGLYYTQLTKHIDSYFTGFNKRVVCSKDFKDFFSENFPVIESHGDAVLEYEMSISKYFEKKGYSFGSYIANKRPHTQFYNKFPNVVNLEDVKLVTKKVHLKKDDNYERWLELK